MGKFKSNLIVAFIFLLLISCSRDKREQIHFNDEALHCALYVNPKGDCLSCINQAMQALALDNDEINVIALRGSNLKEFEKFIKNDYPQAKISFVKKPLALPSPSLLLVKKSSVYMFFYISPNPIEMGQSIAMAKKVLENFEL